MRANCLWKNVHSPLCALHLLLSGLKRPMLTTYNICSVCAYTFLLLLRLLARRLVVWRTGL